MTVPADTVFHSYCEVEDITFWLRDSDTLLLHRYVTQIFISQENKKRRPKKTLKSTTSTENNDDINEKSNKQSTESLLNISHVVILL